MTGLPSPSHPVPLPGALLQAVWDNDLVNAERLLKQGSNADEKDSLGNSSLIHAARNGSRDMMRLLLDNGADIDSQNMSGYNALNYLVISFDIREDLIRLLLERGANTTLKNDNGYTAIELAFQRAQSRPQVFGILREAIITRKCLAEEFTYAAEEKTRVAGEQRRAEVAVKQESLKAIARKLPKPGPKPPEAA